MKSLTHCHSKINGNVMDKNARKRLILASLLCVSFMIAEIIGGLFANSLAIATDAAHLLTDFASFMISLFALWFASRPATQKMSFGWYVIRFQN
jgi:cation diffusion facilitator family transporter